jgi:hypothetical protein
LELGIVCQSGATCLLVYLMLKYKESESSSPCCH